MSVRYKVTIEVTYDDSDNYPDPSTILDSIQDNVEGLLSPYGEKVEKFEVSVEDLSARVSNPSPN